MIDLSRIDWRKEVLGLALGIAAAIVGVLATELAGVDTADELRAINWMALGVMAGRSAVSAVLAALGVAIPGISAPRTGGGL